MEIKNFQQTPWCAEYQRFQSDPAYAREKTARELSGLVGRVIGDPWKNSFVFRQEEIQSANGGDACELYEENGKIVICGPNGVAMASGFNYYLKKYALVN